jgi:hypothetical protein
MTFYSSYRDSIYVTFFSPNNLGFKLTRGEFENKLITSIVENYKYGNITLTHQHEKGGNPIILKNKNNKNKNEMLGCV